MAKVIIEIWDEDGEIKTIGKIDPPVGPDQLDVTPATIIGLFLHSHMANVYSEAIRWASTPQTEDEPPIAAPKLIVPEGGLNG
jgi:hypothetical protein